MTTPWMSLKRSILNALILYYETPRQPLGNVSNETVTNKYRDISDGYCKAQPLASAAEQSARCSLSSAVSARQPSFWLAHSELLTVPAEKDHAAR